MDYEPVIETPMFFERPVSAQVVEQGGLLAPSMSFGPPTFSGALWDAELTREKNTYTWNPESEQGFPDILFLKGAILGQMAVEGERNIVTVTFKNAKQEDMTHPVLSLTLGREDQRDVELTFMRVEAVTFKLVAGSGPVHLVGQQTQNQRVDTLSVNRKVSIVDTDISLDKQKAVVEFATEAIKKYDDKYDIALYIANKFSKKYNVLWEPIVDGIFGSVSHNDNYIKFYVGQYGMILRQRPAPQVRRRVLLQPWQQQRQLHQPQIQK